MRRVTVLEGLTSDERPHLDLPSGSSSTRTVTWVAVEDGHIRVQSSTTEGDSFKLERIPLNGQDFWMILATHLPRIGFCHASSFLAVSWEDGHWGLAGC
jgi:hypothetical protein